MKLRLYFGDEWVSLFPLDSDTCYTGGTGATVSVPLRKVKDNIKISGSILFLQACQLPFR